MELVIALAVGALVGWGYFRLRERSVLADGEVPALVRRVHATAHFDTGDVEVTVLKRLRIDGEMTTYELYVPSVPFNGVLKGTTIHVGSLDHRVAIERQTLRKGDSLTIYQPVGIANLD